VKARRVKGLDPAAPLADNVERIVRVRLDELYSFIPRALDPSEVEALHDMRIAAKRLRYILETTADACFGPYAETAAKRARQLQDLLGEIHDCDVTLPRVLELLGELRAGDAAVVRAAAGDAEDLDPALAAAAPHADAWRGLTTLTVHLRARRTLLFERFVELWRDLEREAFRERLEYAAGERPDGVRAALERLDEAAEAVARAAARQRPSPDGGSPAGPRALPSEQQ
jgi:hypothetical protein